MDKKKLEMIAVTVLIAVFVFLLSGSLRKVSAKLKAGAKAVAGAAQAPRNAEPAAAPKKAGKADIKEEAYQDTRDPFALPENPTSGLSSLSDLKLTGITVNGKGKTIAIINEYMVSVGGKIGNLTVVSIGANKVTLSDGVHNYDIKLEQ